MKTLEWYQCLLLTAVVVLLPACTTTNPREGGFVGGVIGIGSGKYKRRIDEQQEELDKLNQAGDDLTARLKLTREERALVKIQRDELENMLLEIERRLQATTYAIDYARQNLDIDVKLLASLEDEQEALKKRLSLMTTAANLISSDSMPLPEEQRMELASVDADAAAIEAKLTEAIPGWRQIAAEVQRERAASKR